MYSKLPLVEQEGSQHDSIVAGSYEQLHYGENTNSLSPTKDDASPSKRPDERDNKTTASSRDRLSFSLVYMLVTLVAGVFIAVGHHLFYSRLDGQPVDTQISQTWVNRIGTGLAFVVKLFFVAAVGIAYTQYQWRTISRKPWKIKQIDSLTGVLNNAWYFYDVSLWTRVPVLTVMAVVSCLIYCQVNTIESQVARYRFNSSQYAWVLKPGDAIGGPGEVIGGWKFVNDFWKASHETSRLATASQLTGQVLQIPTSYNNASYQVRLEAPALKCRLASDSLTDIVNDTLSQLIPVQFMSWVPSDDHNITTGDSTTILNNYNLYGSIDQVSTDHARLYVLSSSSVSSWRLFECGLHNATYEVAFEFKDSKQHTTILSINYP
ncbi:hypothetical protein LTR70_009672 [Exophiala xenobiotica]|nr:hypothetical protein LTR70_009672 [Exophiala xenobiotica]